ncbi:hypothetical protein O0I10_006304 [Lichtheimia ornata]|uniref:Uncharacterized protein n=1 Tax=Lichtheimia ornata TaxID=688661 RepID=A0AAD7V3N8_9FUNG|nr:uncharacterized protein O0I10_006304 [Lichtheimia ornata]KAJ8658033.1 hypothetical protein O0I10_006304 [Lichtheimia ornata]
MLPATGVPITIDNPTRNVQLDQMSSTVHDCDQKLVPAFHSRASLLSDCGQLITDMGEATAAMTIAPTSSVGYLCAGRIFSDRGQHASAIKMYDDGLQHVPNSDDGYAQLVSAKAASQDQLNKRIDFVTCLPLEIVSSNVVPRILGGQKMMQIGPAEGYLDVSRTWRERIAMAGGLTFRVGPSPLSARTYDYLLDMAPFIKSFTVWGLHDGMVDQLTSRTMFTALKTLNVDVRSRRFNQLLPVLHSMGASLTQLTIDYQYCYTYGTPYRLSDYLDQCPNLVALSIQRGMFDTSFVSSKYPKLKKLDLIKVNVKMDEDTMLEFLRPIPQLQVLNIIPTPCSTILPAIHQSCPLLQQLFLAKNLPPCLSGLGDIHHHEGLRAMIVMDPGKKQRFKGDDMMGYIVKHCDTIESLEIGPGLKFSMPRTVLGHAVILDMTFIRLRQISYPTHAGACYIPLIVWLLQLAPQLESLETVHGSMQAAVFEELMRPSHHHFKSIGLKANGSSEETEKRFMQHHLALGHESNLKEIHIQINNLQLSDSWLLLITQLTQLRQLEVSCEGARTMHGVVIPFISHIASGCPGLERFTLTSLSLPVDYKILSIIAPHTTLATISINASCLIGDASLLPSFIGRLQHLQALHLNLHSFDDNIYAALKSSSFQFVYT